MSKNKDVALNTNIPVTFQKVSQFDNRFVQVKIFLMHLGLNYNGSVFTKESVERALPSLKNTPILGYVDENAIGQKDYAGHEMELVVEDGDYKFKYLGSAFGVIPETNNARWETKRGDDGQEREYLVVDGLMWSKFDDAMGILDRDQIKGQSMELHDDYDGEFDEEGNFVFNKFSFYGACILGDGVQPAMQRATVERVFSADMLNQEVNKMMEEFKLNYGSFENKEVKEGNEVTFEEMLEKFGVTAEQLTEKGINAEEYSMEELEAKIKEAFEVTEEESPETNQSSEEGKQEPEQNHEADKADEDEKGDEGAQDTPEDEFQAEEGKESQKPEDTPEDEFEAPEGDGEESNKKSGESEEGDEEPSEDFEKLYSELTTKYEKLQEDFEEVQGKLDKFEKASHKAQADAVIDSFGLDEDDVKAIKENVHNFSIEQIEEKMYALVGRKNFSIEQPKPNKIAVQQEGNTQTGKSYSHLFAKHGIE